MDIIEEMIRYNLTLRRLDDHITCVYNLPRNPTSEDLYDAQETVIADSMDKEKFERLKDRGWFENCRWEDKKVYKKIIVRHRPKEAGWLVKQDNSHDSWQIWNRNKDFFGRTAEEAIRKAVEYYQKKEQSL